MRVGLTSPFGHPHVWRGAERYCRELAAWMGEQGHECIWLVTTTGETHTTTLEPDGVRIHYQHRSQDKGWGADRYDLLLRCVLPLARAVRQQDLDLVQAHHYVDAAAVRMASGRRTPYVMWLPGLPRQASLAGLPLHRAAFRAAVRGAARVHCLSEFARRGVEAELGVRAHVMRPGVATKRYEGPRPEGDPMILCAAAPADPRKRVGLLVEVFPDVLSRVPDARLVLASQDPEAATRLVDALPEAARQRAQVVASPSFEDLAALYRQASVSVLPSVDEAFGLVMVESLASGTPVVASDRGAAPEVVSNDGVGRLFAADEPRALIDAIVDAVALSGDADTAAACRAHAAHWDWSSVGPELMEIYRDLI